MGRTKQTPKRIASAAEAREVRSVLRHGVPKPTSAAKARKPAPRMEAGPRHAPPGPPMPRYRPASAALREIRRFEQAVTPVFPKTALESIVGTVGDDVVEEAGIMPDATAALQEAAEAYVVELLKASGACALHGKRVTITVKDMQLARPIRGERM